MTSEEKHLFRVYAKSSGNIPGLAALLGGSALSTTFVALICDMTPHDFHGRMWKSADTAYHQLNLLFQMNTHHLGWHFISQK